MLIFYSILALAANCLGQIPLTQYLLAIAQKEAEIAEIPQYKSGMLVDKGSPIDKVTLIQQYKKSHLQQPLTSNQITEINDIEQQKKEFLRSCQ
jgi:hypothetical protein